MGSRVSEMRIDYGPGYRVYFVSHGKTVEILLCGGDKRTQARDINGFETMPRKATRKTKLKTTRFDAADYLKTKADIAAYLDAILEDGDPDLLKVALGDIVRAKGMTEIAKEAGLGRSNLYKALSPEGNPEFTTVASVLKALGLRLSVAA